MNAQLQDRSISIGKALAAAAAFTGAALIAAPAGARQESAWGNAGSHSSRASMHGIPARATPMRAAAPRAVRAAWNGSGGGGHYSGGGGWHGGYGWNGGYNGWHGGYYGWHGGYYGGRWYGGGAYWWPYYAWGYPFYPYWWGYSWPYYSYPLGEVAPSYGNLPPPPQFWYYCDAARGYYPSVPSCPGGWRPVPAAPPPSTGASPPEAAPR